MSDFDINELMKSLEKESNSTIINLNSRKIKDHKNNILQKLQIKKTKLKEFHKKLKQYRYCSEISDLQEGFFIRWISLKNPDDLKLTNGGHITEILIFNEGAQIRLKNSMNRFFQIKFDEVIIFQKISQQENVILTVVDYLDK